MRDYEELSKRLRYCPAGNPSICQLNYEFEEGGVCQGCEIKFEAADAIEELLATVRSVVHCKDCEWWTKQEASIQGRCARLAIYPTGEFYCASGSKAAPPKGVE
jgi:hypothetical protein